MLDVDARKQTTPYENYGAFTVLAALASTLDQSCPEPNRSVRIASITNRNGKTLDPIRMQIEVTRLAKFTTRREGPVIMVTRTVK